MKLFYALLFLPAIAFCQLDTVTVGSTSVIGKMTNNYKDRIIIETVDGINYMIFKERVSSMSVKNKVLVNGMVGYEYAKNMNEINFKGLKPYKDQSFHLKKAGLLGIISSSFMLGGGFISGIGSGINYESDRMAVMVVGSIIATVGMCTLVPTFVHVRKAGKVKKVREL